MVWGCLSILQYVCLKTPLAAFSCPITSCWQTIARFFCFFFASLEASAAMAQDDVFVKLYDLLILKICCVFFDVIEGKKTPLPPHITRHRCNGMTSVHALSWRRLCGQKYDLNSLSDLWSTLLVVMKPHIYITGRYMCWKHLQYYSIS